MSFFNFFILLFIIFLMIIKMGRITTTFMLSMLNNGCASNSGKKGVLSIIKAIDVTIKFTMTTTLKKQSILLNVFLWLLILEIFSKFNIFHPFLL